MNNHKKELIKNALFFSYMCAGEGIFFPGYGVAGNSEEFLYRYSVLTGDEDWETLHERIFDEEKEPDPTII